MVSLSIPEAIAQADRIARAVWTEIPKQIPRNNRLLVYRGLFCLAGQHHLAMMKLLNDSESAASGLALLRPTVEAVYRAIWILECASDEQIKSFLANEMELPGLWKAIDTVNQAFSDWAPDALTIPKQYLSTVHGLTHGGLEQLYFNGLIDENDDLKIGKDHVITSALTAATSLFALCGMFLCQIVEGTTKLDGPKSLHLLNMIEQAYAPAIHSTTYD